MPSSEPTDEDVQELIDHRQLVTADGTRIFEASAMATQIACARAMRNYGARRIVAFHPGIPESTKFADHFPRAAGLISDENRPTGPVWSEQVDGGGMARSKRIRILHEFEQPGEDFRMLSNVKLLTEGVDVPGIDGIAFVDTHRGSVSIIQAVGRAMRCADGKEAGTIILPIIVRHGEDIPAALARGEHRDIVEILGALRSHDPEIFRSLDALRFTAHPEDQSHAPRRFMIDAPVDVDESFADAIDIALTRALGSANDRAPRRRAQPAPLRASQPPRPLSEEEIFERGLDVLWEHALWGLAPVVPDSISGFPLGTWWDEIKKRWFDGDLDRELMPVVADTVSWLAPDLGPPESKLRREFRALTRYSPPEQLVVQLSRQGVHATGSLAPLASSDRDFFDRDGLVERLEAVHAKVTHAAMSTRMQIHFLLAALRPLAEATAAARDEEGDISHWEREPIQHGYIDRLDDDPQLLAHWWVGSAPESYMAGYRAADGVLPLVRRMSLYRFEGDEAAVKAIRAEDRMRSPNDRLDALAFDIYLLARHRGSDDLQALQLARPGRHNTLADRIAMRDHLIERQLPAEPVGSADVGPAIARPR